MIGFSTEKIWSSAERSDLEFKRLDSVLEGLDRIQHWKDEKIGFSTEGLDLIRKWKGWIWSSTEKIGFDPALKDLIQRGDFVAKIFSNAKVKKSPKDPNENFRNEFLKKVVRKSREKQGWKVKNLL